MWYRFLADAVVILHLGFIVFGLFGGLLVFKWRNVSLVHLPAVIWAVWVEWKGWICPLTPLENWFRHQAGIEGYQETFIDHYLVPVIYPSGLTREWQLVFGAIVILLNLIIYCWVWFVRSRLNLKT